MFHSSSFWSSDSQATFGLVLSLSEILIPTYNVSENTATLFKIVYVTIVSTNWNHRSFNLSVDRYRVQAWPTPTGLGCVRADECTPDCRSGFQWSSIPAGKASKLGYFNQILMPPGVSRGGHGEHSINDLPTFLPLRSFLTMVFAWLFSLNEEGPLSRCHHPWRPSPLKRKKIKRKLEGNCSMTKRRLASSSPS